jgi:hypothetical protein
MNDVVRQLVRQRARNCCEYCLIPQSALPWAAFHIEHIRAKQHGCSDELENLALACRRCNSHKGPNLSAVDPRTGEVVLLFNPRVDRWTEHFAEVDFRVVGVSAVGRATVTLLEMNDADRIQVRAEISS